MSPSEQIDQLIAKLTDWRGKTLAGIRKNILETDREIIEEWKWMGSPVWSRHGMIAIGNAHKEKVKLTFSHGAKLPDPDKLFNAGREGGTWRAIDFFEGDKIKAGALKNLIRAAIDYNRNKPTRAAPKVKTPKGSGARSARRIAERPMKSRYNPSSPVDRGFHEEVRRAHSGLLRILRSHQPRHCPRVAAQKMEPRLEAKIDREEQFWLERSVRQTSW